MKARMFVVLMIVVMLAAACTPTPAVPVTNEGKPAPGNPSAGEAYPAASGNAYPAAAPLMSYPDLLDGGEIVWEQAVGLVLGGQVAGVTVQADTTVLLTLHDGRTLKSAQPAADALQLLIDQCGAPCQGLVSSTQ